MKPKNFNTLVMTSAMGLFFGIVGCVLGLKAMGMPFWGVAVGIGIAGAAAILAGLNQSSELYDDSSES